MLVLTRLVGEEIAIEPGGGTITVKVVGVVHSAGGKVKVQVGIDAPRSTAILRKELVGKYEELRRQAEARERDREVANGRQET